jgi:hypothetical protein
MATIAAPACGCQHAACTVEGASRIVDFAHGNPLRLVEVQSVRWVDPPAAAQAM